MIQHGVTTLVIWTMLCMYTLATFTSSIMAVTTSSTAKLRRLTQDGLTNQTNLMMLLLGGSSAVPKELRLQ